ncbi:MAG: WxcM-like domain-containing protein [Flavobacteriales bacterium]|nr:WxcM-like domain-containing protein [Flavobacteriales bacterium]
METVKHIGTSFSDARGEITNIHEGEFQHIALITSKKGAVRGNHYHEHLHQYIYLLEGKLETYCCEVDDPDNKQMLIVEKGDLIDTPPLLAHAQIALEDSVYIALSTHKRLEGKYEEDTIAYQVVEGYLNADLVR